MSSEIEDRPALARVRACIAYPPRDAVVTFGYYRCAMVKGNLQIQKTTTRRQEAKRSSWEPYCAQILRTKKCLQPCKNCALFALLYSDEATVRPLVVFAAHDDGPSGLPHECKEVSLQGLKPMADAASWHP